MDDGSFPMETTRCFSMFSCWEAHCHVPFEKSLTSKMWSLLRPTSSETPNLAFYFSYFSSIQSVGCLFSAGSAKVARPRPGRCDEEGGAVRAGLSSPIGKLT